MEARAVELGFPSTEMAQIVLSIASPVTKPASRKALFNDLRRKQLRSTSAQANLSIVGTPNSGGNGNSGLPKPTFSLCAIPSVDAMVALSAIQSQLKDYDIQLKVSQQLPMVHFPVGPEDSGMSLLMLVDTGAGSSLGYLPYHLDCYRKFPGAFAVPPVALSDLPGSQSSISMGGISQPNGSEGNPSSACTITHLCAYLTPYVIDGTKVKMVFALSPNCAVNTIAGFPLLYGCKMSILLESMSVISGTLGVAMPLSLRRPYNSDTAPDMPAEMPASLTAIPEAVPDTLGPSPLAAPQTCAQLKDINDMVLNAKAAGMFGLPAFTKQQLDDHLLDLMEEQEQKEEEQSMEQKEDEQPSSSKVNA
jgi:hypothetical protein